MIFKFVILIYFLALLVHCLRTTFSGMFDGLEICCHIALLLFLSIALHSMEDDRLNQQISASTALLALSACLVSFIFGISLGRSWTLANITIKKRSRREKIASIESKKIVDIDRLVPSPTQEYSPLKVDFSSISPKSHSEQKDFISLLSADENSVKPMPDEFVIIEVLI